MISDIAEPSRASTRYPFMRYKEWFAGHGWASGLFAFGRGCVLLALRASGGCSSGVCRVAVRLSLLGYCWYLARARSSVGGLAQAISWRV